MTPLTAVIILELIGLVAVILWQRQRIEELEAKVEAARALLPTMEETMFVQSLRLAGQDVSNGISAWGFNPGVASDIEEALGE